MKLAMKPSARHLLILISLLFAPSAFAFDHYFFPYISAFGHPGVWGYVPWTYAPVGYWYYPNYSGYSFYPYYNYQPRFATYGAISYSRATDTFGTSWGQPNFASGVNAANMYCGVGDCQPVVWVQGGCAVVTTSPSAQRISWGLGVNRMEAFQASLSACVYPDGRRAPDCYERAWTCTY